MYVAVSQLKDLADPATGTGIRRATGKLRVGQLLEVDSTVTAVTGLVSRFRMGKCLCLSSYTSADKPYKFLALLDILAHNHVDPAERLAHVHATA